MEINISCVQYYNVQVQTGDVDASENDLETYGGGGGGGGVTSNALFES